MNRPRAADDFATIRARLHELRRERAVADTAEVPAPDVSAGTDGEPERRRRARIAGLPPPWAPTIFLRD